MLKGIASRVSLLTGLIFLFVGAFIFPTISLANLDDGLVAHWNFDEGSGSILHSSVGGYDGNIIGATWASGISGSALYFDADGEHVVFSSSVLNTPPYTFCAWVKALPLASESPYILANGGETEYSYGIAMLLQNNNMFAIGCKDAAGYGGGNFLPFSTEWTYLCGVWDGTYGTDKIKLYLNGSLAATANAELHPYSNSPLPLYIGGTPHHPEIASWRGLIDEVRLYNRVLSDAEIQQLYGGGTNQPYYFVHITDPHVVALEQAQFRWAMVIERIKAMNPAPAFVLCTGDLVDYGQGLLGIANYDALKWYLREQGGTLYIDDAHSIPIYFCPGNHDSRTLLQLVPPYSFDNYHSLIGPNYYMVKIRDCAIFSLNTGSDIWPYPGWPWWPCPGSIGIPESDGLSNGYGNEVSQFPIDLDNLDGIANHTDNSQYYKIVLIHQPYYTESDRDGVFWNNGDSFRDACNTYAVDLALCGHIHDSSPLPTAPGCNTNFVITHAIAYDMSYRIINVNPGNPYRGGLTVEPPTRMTSTLAIIASCRAEVDVYDHNGNHDGPNSADSIEINIPYSYYSHWVADDDTLNFHYTYTEVSLFKEDTTDYTLVFKSLSDDSMHITLATNLVSGLTNKAVYAKIPVDSGSVATLHASHSEYDYTIDIDDNGDGIPDRHILPDSLTGFRGDANADGVVDVGDVVCLINYLFKSGPAPNPLLTGDTNCDSTVDVGDVVYLINYLFKSGPAPSCK